MRFNPMSLARRGTRTAKSTSAAPTVARSSGASRQIPGQQQLFRRPGPYAGRTPAVGGVRRPVRTGRRPMSPRARRAMMWGGGTAGAGVLGLNAIARGGATGRSSMYGSSGSQGQYY